MSWQDEWDVVNPLGGGGQGNTWLVKRKGEDNLAVLKTLREEKKNDQQARARMHREVVALQTLSETEAKIPKVLGGNTDKYGEKGTELHFVMSYIPGPTLEEYITEHGRMTLEEAIRVTRELAWTLNIGHGESLLHRDLKPKNIILAECDPAVGSAGSPYVVDYGLSFNGKNDDPLTRTVENIWNEHLSLPETNVQGEDKRDIRSDVTLLAAIFYYCLTAHAPQVLRDPADLAPHRRPDRGISHASPEPLVVAQLNQLFDRAFATLSRRFENCNDLTAEIDKVTSTWGSSGAIDLVAIGNQASELLLAGNRETQLANLREKAAPLMKPVKSAVSKAHGTYNLFKVSVKDSTTERALTEPYHRLTSSYQVNLSCEPLNVSAARNYAIAARGMDLVLVVTQRNADSKKAELELLEILDVREIDDEATLLISHELKAWIADQIKLITSLNANNDQPRKERRF